MCNYFFGKMSVTVVSKFVSKQVRERVAGFGDSFFVYGIFYFYDKFFCLYLGQRWSVVTIALARI